MNIAEQLDRHKPLSELIDGLAPLPPRLSGPAITVSGLQMDSRLLQRGDLFIACFGRNHDAREYIDQAVAAGCVAVLAESGERWQGINHHQGVPVIAVDNLWARISEIAARFYDRPSTRLSVIGITGTNGKTSCSQFIANALTRLGHQCGSIGTLGYGAWDQLEDSPLTTPDAVFTQRALAKMAAAKIDPVAMEVSSVGLHQKRVAAVHFHTAIFTNLTRDHLDYHESMEAYARNKLKLFTAPGLRRAVINLDDPYALDIINNIAPDVEILTYSIDNPSATVHARQLKLTPQGFQAVLATPAGAGRISGGLLGRFNFSNVLATAATVSAWMGERGGVNNRDLWAALSQLESVAGRMERVSNGGGVSAVVDYAHTPDGLRCALRALRTHFQGAIWCVFGCGGNRDKGKRSLMGEIAEQFADRAIITDDNPRNENGDDIVQHILCGCRDPSRVSVIRDRAEAIAFAVNNAAAGDVVLVAGKGHETSQDVGGDKLPFSDLKQVRLAMKQRPRRP